jgi:hypothetical protein
MPVAGSLALRRDNITSRTDLIIKSPCAADFFWLFVACLIARCDRDLLQIVAEIGRVLQQRALLRFAAWRHPHPQNCFASTEQ